MRSQVRIVMDGRKGKLRAQAADGGWVRFPNDLRTAPGVVYEVENLIPGKSGSWIAAGKITHVPQASDKNQIRGNIQRVYRKKPVDLDNREIDFYAEIRKVHGK